MNQKKRDELAAAVNRRAKGQAEHDDAMELLNRARRRHPVSVLAIGARRVGMERAVRAIEYVVAIEAARMAEDITDLKAVAAWWGISRTTLYRHRTDFLLAFPGLDTSDFVTAKKARAELRRILDDLDGESPASRRHQASVGVAEFAAAPATGAVAS